MILQVHHQREQSNTTFLEIIGHSLASSNLVMCSRRVPICRWMDEGIEVVARCDHSFKLRDLLTKKRHLFFLFTPWKVNGWNLQITHLERKMIFQTSMMMFHVNLEGVKTIFLGGGIFRENPARLDMNTRFVNEYYQQICFLDERWPFPIVSIIEMFIPT